MNKDTVNDAVPDRKFRFTLFDALPPLIILPLVLMIPSYFTGKAEDAMMEQLSVDKNGLANVVYDINFILSKYDEGMVLGASFNPFKNEVKGLSDFKNVGDNKDFVSLIDTGTVAENYVWAAQVKEKDNKWLVVTVTKGNISQINMATYQIGNKEKFKGSPTSKAGVLLEHKIPTSNYDIFTLSERCIDNKPLYRDSMIPNVCINTVYVNSKH
jgi:hypothetical protein